MRPVVLSAVLGLVVLVGCATQAPARRASEQLYLAVELREHGHTVAAPRLLGFEGHRITAQRTAPGATAPDYRLVLRPEESGSGYRVWLDVQTAQGSRRGKVGLLHGEERSIALDPETELKVMIMRVDSPEFRALLSPSAAPTRGAI